VTLEQHLECARVTVLRARDEDRVAELLVDEAAVGLHPSTVVVVSGLLAPVLHGRLGVPYRYVEECASTQRLLAEDDPEGAVAVADHQTAGRGRLGRVWEDAAGRSLLVSVLLRPSAPMPLWPELSLVAGEAVARAVGGGAAVSNPNDVMIGGRKVAGVLPEATRGRVVLGIGVNVNQARDELPLDTVKPATSLRIELGREVDRAELLAAVLLELERGYDVWDARYRR
jgi:biotin-[acetyl-CoA-carboxylase] ligase BirA-like protein